MNYQPNKPISSTNNDLWSALLNSTGFYGSLTAQLIDHWGVRNAAGNTADVDICDCGLIMALAVAVLTDSRLTTAEWP